MPAYDAAPYDSKWKICKICTFLRRTYLCPAGDAAGYSAVFRGTLEELLQFALLREDSAELATAVESMRELKDSQIMAACQKELVSQLEDLSCACGADTAHVTVRFSDSSEGIADAVSISISILGGNNRAVQGHCSGDPGEGRDIVWHCSEGDPYQR